MARVASPTGLPAASPTAPNDALDDAPNDALDDASDCARAGPARQRLEASALIAAARGRRESTLVRLEQRGGAKIRLPRCAPGPLTAVTLNTAGGLTGDDRIHWEAIAGERSRLTVASAASEKIYRTHGPPALQTTRLVVDRDARLDWLPQETIVFDGARLHRSLDATLAPGARLLLVEALLLGRQASNERIDRIDIRDRWRVRGADGRLLHAEDLRLDGDWPNTASGPGTLAGAHALATLLYCDDGPAESLALLARELHATIEEAPCAGRGGASAMPGRLLVRLVAPDGFALRQRLLPCLSILQGRHPVPRVWYV